MVSAAVSSFKSSGLYVDVHAILSTVSSFLIISLEKCNVFVSPELPFHIT